jgi:hypothetical protein
MDQLEGVESDEYNIHYWYYFRQLSASYVAHKYRFK